MISVEEAQRRIVGAFAPLRGETVAVGMAAGRVLAADIVARTDHPPAAMSAMDGYAVKADGARAGARLAVIGTAPAGHPFSSSMAPGQAVRIFTGGIVPDGADAVVIQEDAQDAEGAVIIGKTPVAGENIRRRGLDFRAGDILLSRGHRLTARDIGLIAAADLAAVRVTHKPRIAIAATGDELSRPGEPRSAGGIVASSTYAVQAMVKKWGAEPVDIGILPDTHDAFATLVEASRGIDMIVTLGGASVGEHDLVQSALKPHGFNLDFWKIAMRPGKPLIFGALKETPLLGLPGNPVSAMVCAVLFLAPSIAAMLGTPYSAPIVKATLGAGLKANGKRQDYLRASLVRRDGKLFAEPFALQDSSMQKIFAAADGLIVRAVGAPAANTGDDVDVFLLDGC